MTRNELIKKLKNNFDIRELVCKHCYSRFGDASWQFISTELLSVLYTLRYKIFNSPITINNWYKGGSYDERGLRCNMCDMIRSKTQVYLSAHCLGKAIDFNVQGKTSQEVNQIIIQRQNEFEYPIRLEMNTDGWSHVDCYQPTGSNANLIRFNG